MTHTLFLVLCGLTLLSIESECFPRNSNILGNSVKEVFFNPITDVSYWDDPDVYLHTDGFYYIPGFSTSTKQLTLYKSRKLSNLRDAEVVDIFYTGSSYNVYTPEIYFLDGEFYIYFGYPVGVFEYSIFVMKANNPNNPMGGWSTPYRLPLPGPSTIFEMDGTILNYGNGQRYIIWVGFASAYVGTQLYISRLCNPTLVCGDRFLLKTIDFAWEADEYERGYLGGPHVLQNDGRTFVIYSANTAMGEDTVFGIMGIDDLKDPLVYENWWRKDEPVFRRNEQENVFALGTSSYTVSPDGTESWMLYTAKNITEGNWGDQSLRIQKFTWNEDGTPNFGISVGLGTALEAPSGEY